MSDKTLWSHPEKQFKPRNKQAAMIIRPCFDIHHPPAAPTLGLTLAQRVEEENRLRRERIAALADETKAHYDKIAKHEAKMKANALKRRKSPKLRPAMQLRWVAKQLKRVNAQRGVAAPTPEEIQKAIGGLCKR